MTLRRTPLFAAHHAAGAKLADFGGWEMPIEYPTGVVAEHTAVRSAVGVFDVSHMGKLVLRGPGAAAALNAVLANDLDRIGPGQAQYSMVCNAAGGVVDDLIVYREGDDAVRIVPNAANAAAVRDLLRAALPSAVSLEDRHEGEGILAIQGPASRDVVVALGLLEPGDELAYMAFRETAFEGTGGVLCRTGYTGEHGYEVVIGTEVLPALWAAVVAAGAVPAGLGARDTLRTEMGYPLHGQDLSPTITPLEAGLSWAVGWDKPAFHGREALLAQRAAGRPRALRGLRVEGRGIPRAGMPVVGAEGAPAGETTSGTFSPTLRQGIALALVDPALAFDDAVAVDVRGRSVPARVVRLPFVDASPK
ncbi:MAG: glycine cleavage system aminomethyltransferase GcvT [Candidatus Nanopelagicales bacterium]|nr:glycine cleavage system aminomethyltransferase GcvT [Candidatus Nanopelagicales bacterium]